MIMKSVLVSLLIAGSLAFAPRGQAGTHTWTGSAANGLWSTPGNWEGSNPPFANESPLHLVFPASPVKRAATNNIANITLSSVTFDGVAYTIAASGQGTNVVFDSSVGQSWWNVRALSGNGHMFHYSMNLALDGNLELNITTNANVTVRSRLSAATANSGLYKTGSGSVYLDPIEDNTFDGTTSIVDGALRLEGSHSQFGFTVTDVTVPGALIIGGNSLAQQPVCLVWQGNQIADSSAVTVNRNGQLLFADVNDTIGSLTMAGGIVDTANGTLTLNGNVLVQNPPSGTPSQFLGHISLGTFGRFFTVETNAYFDVSAIISGGSFGNAPAGVNKLGPGWMALHSSSNTFGGDLYVSIGTVSITNGKQIGAATNAASVANGGTLALSGIGFGPIVNDKLLNLQTGARLTALLDSEWNGPVQLYGQAIIDVPDNTLLSMGGVISGVGGITKTGKGELRLTGNSINTFTGGLVAAEGELRLAKGTFVTSVPGPLTIGTTSSGLTTATVVLGNSHQIANSASVTIHLFSMLDSADFSDAIGDVEIYGGDLTSSGTGLWTLTGQVNVHAAAWPGVFSGQVSVGAILRTFHCDLNADLLVTAPLIGTGSGGVLKTGPGLLSFFAANTYPGLTKVQEGSLYLVQDGLPGSTAAGTEVGPDGSLRLANSTVIGESLTLDGNGTNPFSLWSQDTNLWQGVITLIGGPNIRSYTNDSLLTLSGPLLGTSGVGFDGPGTVVFAGAADNAYQGNTVVLGGTLALNKLNATAIPGNLVIGAPVNGSPASSVVCQRSSQFAPVSQATLPSLMVTINPNGALHCGGYFEFIANITMLGGAVFTENGLVYLHGNLTVQANAGGSGSYYLGKLALASPYADHTHQVNIESNGSLLLWGEVSQGTLLAHLQKIGGGDLSMICSNSFEGNFILSNGRVMAGGVQPFATLNGVTIVQNGATLMVFGGEFAELISLEGSGYANQGALVALGTNTFNGTMSFAADAKVATPTNTDLAIVNGVINGPGGFTKVGEGRFQLAGSADNTFSGVTRVQQGALELTKTNATAITGAVEIAVGSGAGLVRYLRSAQLGDLASVTIGDYGQLRLLGYSDTIGSLSGSGTVELLAGTLTTGNDPTPMTYSGVINGIGGHLTKVGSGVFTLTGNNTYTGTTLVRGGTLGVNGHQPASDVSIQTGGALAGNGTVGAISDQTGFVKPGATTYGTLKCGALSTFAPVNQFVFDINGTTPGVDCDQLDVTGSVLLMGGTLQVAMNFPGAVSNQYVIVKNDGVDPVTGSFIGLPQDALFTANGVSFRINYHGGDGNDIVLIQQSVATGPQIGGITKLNDGTIQVTAQGQPNASYIVEATESLSPPIHWNAIGDAIANATGQIIFVDTDAPLHPIRFYRFVLP
jgi:autotransporter-associated beta strand protein